MRLEGKAKMLRIQDTELALSYTNTIFFVRRIARLWSPL